MLKNVKYILTTHVIEKMPQDNKDEIVIVGRSNVGKSTFINALTNNSKLAYVSSRPGKTKALSFFDVQDTYRIVDIPGYGYSKVSKLQKDIFEKMIETFFKKRENIKLVIILVDIRNKFVDNDLMMIDYLQQSNIKYEIFGTKLDKTNQSEQYHFKKACEQYGVVPLMISSVTKKNYDKVENIFNAFL